LSRVSFTRRVISQTTSPMLFFFLLLTPTKNLLDVVGIFAGPISVAGSQCLAFCFATIQSLVMKPLLKKSFFGCITICHRSSDCETVRTAAIILYCDIVPGASNPTAALWLLLCRYHPPPVLHTTRVTLFCHQINSLSGLFSCFIQNE